MSWVPHGGADHHLLVIRENNIAEEVLVVILLEGVVFVGGSGDEEVKKGVGKHWCISLGLGVVYVLKISKDNDSEFGEMRLTIIVGLDNQNVY